MKNNYESPDCRSVQICAYEILCQSTESPHSGATDKFIIDSVGDVEF